MARSDNAYSRIVATLKIVLPLAALGLLSTLFLFARPVDPTRSIPFAEVDVEELAREQRLAQPTFAGVTEDGSAITVSARVAWPGESGTGGLTAADLSARIDTAEGIRFDLSASDGYIDPGAARAGFSNGVRVQSSNGYLIETESLTTSLDRTDTRSDAPLRAVAPFGTLEAGGFALTASGGEGAGEGGALLVFHGGVKLVYRPDEEG
jgi:lipopolysaccharide export system protein LptC